MTEANSRFSGLPIQRTVDVLTHVYQSRCGSHCLRKGKSLSSETSPSMSISLPKCLGPVRPCVCFQPVKTQWTASSDFRLGVTPFMCLHVSTEPQLIVLAQPVSSHRRQRRLCPHIRGDRNQRTPVTIPSSRRSVSWATLAVNL